VSKINSESFQLLKDLI